MLKGEAGTVACFAADAVGRIFDWRPNCEGPNRSYGYSGSGPQTYGEAIGIGSVLGPEPSGVSMILQPDPSTPGHWIGTAAYFYSETEPGFQEVTVSPYDDSLADLPVTPLEHACRIWGGDVERRYIVTAHNLGILFTELVRAQEYDCGEIEDEFVASECLKCGLAIIDDVYGF